MNVNTTLLQTSSRAPHALLLLHPVKIITARGWRSRDRSRETEATGLSVSELNESEDLQQEPPTLRLLVHDDCRSLTFHLLMRMPTIFFPHSSEGLSLTFDPPQACESVTDVSDLGCLKVSA